jgi:hypothetical protein
MWFSFLLILFCCNLSCFISTKIKFDFVRDHEGLSPKPIEKQFVKKLSVTSYKIKKSIFDNKYECVKAYMSINKVIEFFAVKLVINGKNHGAAYLYRYAERVKTPRDFMIVEELDFGTQPEYKHVSHTDSVEAKNMLESLVRHDIFVGVEMPVRVNNVVVNGLSYGSITVYHHLDKKSRL